MIPADVVDPSATSQPDAPPVAPPAAPTKPRDTTATPARPPDKPPAAAPPAAAPPETAAPLETTSDVTALEQQTQTLLANAERDLGRVDVHSLGIDAKAQYQRARSFVAQARKALDDKNYTYARNMADKAAALAGQLPKTKA